MKLNSNQIYICVTSKPLNENVVTQQFLDLTMYVKCVLHEDEEQQASTKITYDLLEQMNLSVKELFLIAQANTARETTIESMLSVLSALMDTAGISAPSMYIIRYSNYNGAGSICCTERLKQLADRLQDDLYIIPSSIHELIAIPVQWGTKEDVNQLIQDVNATEVKPEERLGDHVYVFNRELKFLS